MEPAKIFTMPIEKTTRSYRFSKVTQDRIERLGELLQKSDTQILEDAIAHLLGTVDRDQPVWVTSPHDRKRGTSGPRRPAA